jgi:hypothetical protein
MFVGFPAKGRYHAKDLLRKTGQNQVDSTNANQERNKDIVNCLASPDVRLTQIEYPIQYHDQ